MDEQELQKDEQEIQEFSLEDIIKEFSDASETVTEEAEEETAAEETEEEELPAETVAEEVPSEEQTPAPEETADVTGDTVRFEKPVNITSEEAAEETEQPEEPEQEEPEQEEPAEAEAFTDNWEPEYEQPIGEYVPHRPILVHPRSRLRELKKKLIAGPEKQYYAMVEKGLGKLQAAIFFAALVVLISAGATVMYAMGVVPENRMRLMVFGQFLAMLVSALLGSFQLIEGAADIVRKRFSLNSLLVFSFLLCTVDGILCLRELRVPCCAAFSLQVFFSLWNSYQKRNTKMGQLDTMRKANHLDGLTAVEDYHAGAVGILRKDAQVEDFMDHYQKPTRYEKVLNIYAIVALIASVVTGIAAGVLCGLTKGVYSGISMGLQVAAVTALAAVPASGFVCQSRPMAVLERRLHAVGAVLCGWDGVETLSKNAVFPVDHEDICPTGSVKLNGVKFFGERESDEIIACCAALCSAAGGALKPLFEHLLESRNGIHYEVADFCAYENGGVGGEVNAEPVLVGSLSFLREMGVEIPENVKLSNCVAVSISSEFCGLFAIAYDKNRSSAAGLATLTGYRKLKVLLTTGDFMLTNEFLKEKFNINVKRVIQPDPQTRMDLREITAPEDAPVAAISTSEGLAPFAYCVTGAKVLRSACRAGMVVHLIGGILGIAMMLVLAVLQAWEYLTPANMFLYQLVWMVPGLLITNWTKPL